MAHRLEPPTGRDYLPCAEVLARIREEFEDVDADQDQGSDDVGDMIAKLIELNAPQHIIADAMLDATVPTVSRFPRAHPMTTIFHSCFNRTQDP